MKEREQTTKTLLNKLVDLRTMLDELQEAIDEFQNAEEQIQEKIIEYEKLSALGRLTANVAHEIRNPITIIGGLSERLRKRLPPEAEEKEYADLISAESKRLEEILKDVLLFSDKSFLQREMKNINKIVEESLTVYEKACQNTPITIRKSLSDVPPVYVDERQVRAAIGNLVSNAIDAMRDGGTLTVTTNAESINGKNLVALKVMDTGIGMSQSHFSLKFSSGSLLHIRQPLPPFSLPA
jgi:signal transduction histidine kinase